MGSETTLAPSQCGKAFGSTDSNLVGYDGVRLILNTCPLWERVWVDRHKPYGLGWGQSHPQYLPTVEKGLGRPTQTLLGQDGVRVTPILAYCGKGFGLTDPNLGGRDGVRLILNTYPLWERVWID